MKKRSIIPGEMKQLYDDWRMSPGIEYDGLVFLTGFNGMPMDGKLSCDAEKQIEAAFSQVKIALAKGDMPL